VLRNKEKTLVYVQIITKQKRSSLVVVDLQCTVSISVAVAFDFGNDDDIIAHPCYCSQAIVIVAYLVDTDLQIIQPILISYFFEDVRIEFCFGEKQKTFN